MNIIIEEVVSEFPVIITEEVVQITISDATSYFDLLEVSDTDFVGKDGYVPVVNEATGKLVLSPQSGGSGGGIPDAPNNSNSYVRSALNWVVGYSKTVIDNLLGNKVDKVTGKGLSTEDYTTSEKNKLSGIEAGAEVNNITDANATDLTDGGQTTLHNHDSRYYTETEVDNIVSNINTNGVYKDTVKLSENISKGQAVYVSDANGTNIIVSKASNTTEATSSKTLGLIETSGVTNDVVNVVTEGLLSGLNTNSATIGDAVWLGTNGNLIFGLTNKPVAPAHLVYIGVVTRVGAVNGEILIKVQNGFELNEIHNVLLSSLLNNDILQYDSASGLWKNKQISAFKKIVKITNSTTTSGTTETLLETISFSANEVAIGDVFSILVFFNKITGGSIAGTIRLRASQTDFASSTIIATYTSGTTLADHYFQRESFRLKTTNSLTGFSSSVNTATDLLSSNSGESSMTIDPSQAWNLYITIQSGNSTATFGIKTAKITVQ